MPIFPPNDQNPKFRKPVAPKELHGDVSVFRDVFVSNQRRLITTSVSNSVLLRLHAYPGGISQFLDYAVERFDGNLPELVRAAVDFVETRKERAPRDPVRNISGRILESNYDRIEEILAALSSIRGMSRAKVVGGLIQLQLY